MGTDSRDTHEQNLGESFEALEFWEQIRSLTVSQFKEIQLDVNSKLTNIESTIDNRLGKIEDNISNRLENITNSLSLIHDLKKTFTDEVINLNNLHEMLKEFKSTNIVINNPTYDDLISQLREILLSEAKSDGERFNKYIDNKNNLLNELIAGRINDLEKLAQKTIKATEDIVNNFNNFSESMKKGNSSILTSETIVAKLLYALRYIEKLPQSAQEELLKFSEQDFKHLSVYIKNSIKKDEKAVEPQEEDALNEEDTNFIDLMKGK